MFLILLLPSRFACSLLLIIAFTKFLHVENHQTSVFGSLLFFLQIISQSSYMVLTSMYITSIFLTQYSSADNQPISVKLFLQLSMWIFPYYLTFKISGINFLVSIQNLLFLLMYILFPQPLRPEITYIVFSILISSLILS